MLPRSPENSSLVLAHLSSSQIPYLLLINTSTFTTEAFRGVANSGVKVLQTTTLSSFTFAAMMDDHLDNGTLSWMNVVLPGVSIVHVLQRKTFLMCA